jgi:hypothetical protein
MKKPALALLITALLSLVHATPALAATADDAKDAQIRQEHPEMGFLFFDATILKDGKLGCVALSAILTSNTGKRTRVDVNTILLSFKGITHGALAPLEPATWSIAVVECYKQTYKGPFAQVRVESGEVVNAGNLVFDVITRRPEGLFTRPIFGARAKIEDLRPETVESLKKRAPETFAKAKRRYFEINPALK